MHMQSILRDSFEMSRNKYKLWYIIHVNEAPTGKIYELNNLFETVNIQRKQKMPTAHSQILLDVGCQRLICF